MKTGLILLSTYDPPRNNLWNMDFWHGGYEGES